MLQEEAAGLRAQIERLKTEKQTVEDFLMDAQQAASTSGEETKRLMEARRREQERWEEERAQSKHIVQEMEAEVGGVDIAFALHKIVSHFWNTIKSSQMSLTDGIPLHT